MFSLILDAGNYASISAQNKSINTYGTMPLFVVDASETSWVDSSFYRAGGSISTRQLVAMDNLRFTVSSKNKQYSFQDRNIITSVKKDFKTPDKINYHLEDNYPNPFNGSTVIRFSMNKPAHTNLVVYNLLGQEVQKLIDNNLESGSYSYLFTPKNSIASGIYLFRLTTQGFSQVKKMIYLR